MKYKGKVITPPSPEIVAFARTEATGEPSDLVFVLKPVLDFTEFEGLCPEPLAPSMLKPGQIAPEKNFEDPTYKEQVQIWLKNRINWICLETIAVGDIVWETVVTTDPSTWENFKSELKTDAQLTPQQIQHLVNRILTVNSIDEKKMNEARERFLIAAPPALARA